MKYTKEERIDIGRQVFTHELSRAEALSKYGIVKSCLDRYIHDYKVANDIPTETRAAGYPQTGYITSPGSSIDIEAYKAMSKEELINELIKAKVNEARAKKGYEVKGDGANKEYVSLNSRNSK